MAEPQKDHTTRMVLTVVVLGALLGLLSVVVGYVDYRTGTTAQRDDVLRNRAVIERVEALERSEQAEAAEHRQRNEELHACIVDLIMVIIRTAPHELARIENPCPSPLAHDLPATTTTTTTRRTSTTTGYRPRHAQRPRATTTTRPPATTTTTRRTAATTTTTRPPCPILCLP